MYEERIDYTLEEFLMIESNRGVLYNIYRLPISDKDKYYQKWIFESPFKDFGIRMDSALLPNNAEIGTFVDIMIVDIEPRNKYYKVIPSPIKYIYVEQWKNILTACNSRKQITAIIKEITDYGFIMDIGCEIYSPLQFPKKYMQNENVGDKLNVNVNISTYATDDDISITISHNFENNQKIYINNVIQKKNTSTFIIDTNIIMDFPELIQHIFEQKKLIIIPYNVIEELDGLKDSDDKEKSKKARDGLKIINENIDSIKFESPSQSLLPSGLDKTKNDNLILSVALDNKNDAPIIVTNDLGLIVKAKSLKIETWDCIKDME